MTQTAKDSHSYLTNVLYSKLEEERNKKNILPTVGGEYVGVSDYYYYNDTDSYFWKDFSFKTGEINRILLPKDSAVNDLDIQAKAIESKDLAEAINSISAESQMTIPERSNLIFHLISNKPSLLNKWYEYSLLVDNENNIINNEVKAFTPKTLETDYKLPTFVEIKFLNNELYETLYERLRQNGYEEQYNKKEDKPNKSRIFANILNDYNKANISSYDKDQVLLSIVSQTNKYMGSLADDEEKCKAIKDMFACLYRIYCESGFQTELKDISLLNKNGQIKKSSELLLYNTDNVNVFGENVEYLLDKDNWGIAIDNEEDFCQFARLLGVNKLIEEGTIRYCWLYGEWLSDNGVFTDSRHTTNNLCKAMENNSTFKFIQMTNLMRRYASSLSINKIILLLATNQEFYPHILNSTVTISFFFRTYSYLQTEYSYLKYQFLTLCGVKNRILSTDIVFWSDELINQIKQYFGKL